MRRLYFWTARAGLLLLVLVLAAGCGAGSSGGTGGAAATPTAPPPTVTPSATPLPATATPGDEAPPPPRLPATLEELEASKWILVSYGPVDNPTPAAPGTAVTANFDNMGELHGETGCNNYHVPFTLKDGVVTPAGVQQTRMACVDQDLSRQEAAYVQALNGISSIERQGEQLVISYPGGELRYRPLPAPKPSPLSGTRWRLTAFDLGDMQQAALPETQVTLEFRVGDLSGSGGCNSYGGAYTADDKTLSVEDTMMTAMACVNEQVMQQEAAFTRALGSASAYEIRDGNLFITYDGGILNFEPLDPDAPLLPQQ